MSYLKRMMLSLLIVSCMLGGGCSRKTVFLETGETRERETFEVMETESKKANVTEDSKALIYVYVCGQVVSPGVYVLTQGDRIYQAIEMAGGVLAEGDIGRLNLAALLSDGQKVYVPSFDETAKDDKDEGMDPVDDALSADAEGETFACVNINEASKDQLMQLSGIGPSKAEAIIRYRQEHGGFQSVEELMAVPGIKEGTYVQIKDRISIN